MTSIPGVIATNRFGLGARPGELAGIGNDPRSWLVEQLRGSTDKPPGELATTPVILQAFFDLRRERRTRKQVSGEKAAAADIVPQVRNIVLPHYLAQAEGRVRLAAKTKRPFRERLVHFWSNHFAVSVDKVACLGIAGSFENEAIRPFVNGSFGDLLASVVAHPAMLLYLDNQASIGPDSMLGTRVKRRGSAGRKIDINENLAREILELHTLGVDGGYTQGDVTEFARVLTGWSIGGGPGPLGDGKAGTFIFRENLHEPGGRTVLGKRYGEAGLAQGEEVLADLAVHASSARHLATKLVRHFINDEPPADSIERVAEAWRKSAGDLPTVYGVLIAEDAAWQVNTAKLKTPWDFAISTYRGLDVVPREQRALLAPFELLGQRIWSPGSPAGWPDTAAAWDGADALMKRIEWAEAAGERLAGNRAPLNAAENMLGQTISLRTRTALSQAESAAQALALLLASPEFLRR